MTEAAALMQDPRVRHYWDADQHAGRAYQGYLDMGSPAWDVWLLFPPGLRWDGEKAPEPGWWEHQLRGMPPDRKLDPERFAAKAKELMGDPEPVPSSD